MLDKPASHTSAKTSGPLAGFRIVEVPVKEAIKNPHGVFEKISV